MPKVLVAERIMNDKYLNTGTRRLQDSVDEYIAEMNRVLMLDDDKAFYPYYEYYYTLVIVNEINQDNIDIKDNV